MSSRGRMPGNTKTLDPRYFVLIKPLPNPTQKGVKVRARSSTAYRRWEPRREDVFWENYHRRHQQLTRQGYWTPSWKPYQELGEMLYLEPKKLTLYYLGQLPQEPAKEDVHVPQEEMTTTKDSPKPKSAPQESLKKPAQFKQLEKNLRTLSKDLTHTRHLINSVKQGRGYFYLLHKESLERKNALKAAQEEQQARWATECQPPGCSSDEEHSDEERNDFFLTDGPLLRKAVKKKMKTVVRPFTPVHNSLLVPNTSEAAIEPLFRQLCALHWLLEALTLEPNCSIKSVLTCWNPKDPGGSKSTLKKINKEKTARYRWEHFIVDTKKSSQKAPRIQLSRKTNKRTSVISISRLSGPSSSHSRTPPGSTPSLVPSSEDYANVNTAPSDGTREFEDSESMQSKQTREDEEPVNYYLQKLLQIIHEDVAKQFDAEDLSKKTRLQSAQPAYQRNERVSISGLKDQENIAFLEQRHKSSLYGAQKDDKVNATADQDSITAGDQRPRSSLSVTVREDKTTTATFKEEESTKHIKRTKSRHASYFIESKCNLHAEMRQKFSAIAEEAALCLHDNLEILERRREEKCSQKYQALKSIKCFERDLERMRQSGTRAEREHDEDECNWFLSLISRLPSAVKNDSRTQKILKKLEKFGKNPDLRIRPSTFLKVLSDLRVWELCSPDISAAVEFVRENIVQIQEEVYKGWLQTQVKIPKRMQSAPPFIEWSKKMVS
ncbi:coiled-coil domain-containing protein 60 isoform X2 [Alligator mississippiensis]|uniref:Coiled-coil domain-containing protein 60 isoform A n=1 Tax=Alligator mississippiensis TaxID=8496 RepID=A0A151N4H2_ALLMI|nr:coiled-coil domain-containing protein 60 isoform X2 [Alligator mississippiensis]KYO31724.1 coiled-coil domain-containing protein 60 isoform A [Alligator mississippiensis]